MLELIDIFLAFQLSVMAYVICVPLMQENMLLTWYDDFLHSFPKWVAYPLGHCEKCFAGQLGFWIWLAYNWDEYNYDTSNAFLKHCLFISFTILFVITIKTIFKRWK